MLHHEEMEMARSLFPILPMLLGAIALIGRQIVGRLRRDK